MASYGTIPTSTPSSKAPVNLDFISKAKDQIKAGLGTRRPWKQMLDLHSLGVPSGFAGSMSRIKTNIAYFRMNYAIVVLGILFLSLLWHPISLIVFLVLMCAWLFLYFLRDEPLTIFNRMINDRTVLIVLSIVTIGGLLLTGATWNILSALLVGVVVVLVHALFRKTEDLFVDEEEAFGLPSSSSSP